MAKRVAVVGLSFRFPSTTTQDYWRDLVEGKDLVTQVDPQRWAFDAYLHPDKAHPGTAYTFAAGSIGDITRFDAAFFGISPREAALMDPQQRLLLELCWEAIEHAGIKPSSLRGSDTGVYIGIASTDYAYRLSDDFDAIDASFATGNTASIAANRLSYVFDLRGPSMALDTACSSSMVAFHQACQAIQSGEISQAIAGGVSLHLHPYGFVTFSKASMLSRRGRCNVFDAAGDGYVRSEGGGLFMLKDYDAAVADGDRILGIVAHSAVNTDGRKSGLTVPSADAQVALMKGAYEKSGIHPDDIDYLEAHGTGTAVGDPIETQAIGMAIGQLRKKPLPIGSVKSNMGHLEAASGVAGLVKALYCLKHREVPATMGINTLNPAIKFDDWNLDVVTDTRPLRARGPLTIGVNSFGFGGANAHIILQSPDEAAVPAPGLMTATSLPLVISGKTPEALAEMADLYADTLQNMPPSAVYDVAYHAAFRREWHERRAVVFGGSPRTLAAQLKLLAAGTSDKLATPSGSAVADARGTAFVYSGNGSQWAGMGRALLEDPVFAQAIADIDEVFQPLAGYRLTDDLSGALDAKHPRRYEQTEFAQPALFGVQVGVTRMLRQSGIQPVAVVGHSVGEVAAAWACGALSLAQATHVIFHRSQLQGRTRGQGAMTAVGLSGHATAELLASLQLDATVSVAGHNSVRGATIAGHPDDLSILEQALAKQRVFHKRLDLDYAFHSPAMDSIEAPLRDALSGLAPSAGRIPFYSSVTGTVIDGQTLDAEYWWHNIRETVRFEQAVSQLVEQGFNIFAEVGPHPVLRSYVNDALKAASREGRVEATAQRGDDSPLRVRACAGQLMLAGADVDWKTFFPTPGRHLDLPSYPWQREVHWHPTTSGAGGALHRSRVHPLLGYAMREVDAGWENQLDTRRCPTLADHVVGEAVLFPGTGFVEITLAAAFESQSAAFAVVEEIDIRSPLLLEPDQTKVLRTVIDQKDGGVTILGKTQGDEDDFVVHAVARILAEPRGIGLSDEPMVLPNRTPDFVAADHEALTRMVGLSYGPAFRAVAHGWRESPAAVLAVLAADSSIAGELPETHLHPALLDNAFQLIIQLLKDDAAMHSGAAFVPAKVGRVVVRGGIRVPFSARATLLRRTPHALVARFELFDAAGLQIALIDEARFRSVRLQKAGAEHVSYLDYLAVPAPRAEQRAQQNSPVDLAALTDQARAQWSAAGEDAATLRFATEVDPLIDALCGQFTNEALRHLAQGSGTLSSGRVQALRQRQPAQAAWVNMLLSRLVEDGAAQVTATGWTFSSTDDQPAALDIWNSLVREYPDYFAIVQAVGRVGLHLPDLLKGARAFDDVRPREATAAGLAVHVQGHAARQALARLVADQVRAAQASLSDGQRLAVLEVGGAGPVAGLACCAGLDFVVSDYHYAAVSGDAAAVAKRSLDAFPAAHVTEIPSTDADTPDRFDLVVVDLGLASLEDARRSLMYSRRRLLSGGAMLVINTHPAGWLDVLMGAQADWWVDGADGAKVSRQQPATYWQAEIATLGLTVREQLDAVPEATVGAYLLIAQHAQADKVSDTVPTAFEGRKWLLIEDGTDQSTSDQLASTLEAAGQQVMRHCLDTNDSTNDADALREHLARDIKAAGPLHGIVHLAGLTAEDDVDAGAALRRQTRRCAVAAYTAQACEAAGTHATIWLITAGASVTLADARSDGRTAATDGTQRVAPLFDDAAVWGFGRTMMNEASGFSVRLIDLNAQSGAFTPTVLDALALELLQPGDETELLLACGPTGDLERRVSRMMQRPEPVAATPELVTTDETTVRLGFEFPGQLRNLRWEATATVAPAADEVEIDIRATGLNFRDVMYALGLLSDEAIESGFAGPTLGLEFSGVVRRVGSDVTAYAPGDAVVGFGPSSFGNCTLTKVNATARMPSRMSFEAAATIPSTFFTVYYAFEHLARLSPGEKVLIHGAAGGVGIAAIQFAQHIGAEIYATAGSDEKRDFLKLMGVTHIYDSRSLAYADEILADTGGQGVDVVLNSLAGEAINRNLRVLKPFGRFLELGKRDFYENTRIGLRPFRNNISYFGIDADQLMHARADLTHRLFADMMALFEQGVLHPLPYHVFDANEVVDAFRYMQQARQIGKIVVTYQHGIRQVHQTTPVAQPRLNLSPDGSFLVTGGLGGFGLRTAQWLVERGARHLILISRSGPTGDEAKAALSAFEQAGVRVHAAACDVTDRDALAAVLAVAGSTLPPLKGLVHAAVAIDDGLVRGMTASQIEHTMAAKLLGAHHLHDLTQDLPLDMFVMYSSATTLLGNPGQSNYVAANSTLESLAAKRRLAGLPATCAKWGAIDDVGFLARNTKIRDALQSRMGGTALPSAVALRALENMILADRSSLGVMELDWRALARFLPSAGEPKFSDIARHGKHDGGDEGQTDDIVLWVATLPEDELLSRFVDILRHEVGDILRVAPEKIDPVQSIYDMGLDSLMGVELVVALEARFGVRLPVMALNDSPTLEKLAVRLARMLQGDDASSDNDSADAARAQIEQLAQQHATEVSDDAVAELVARMTSSAGQSNRMIN